jgi:hypothetical protein
MEQHKQTSIVKRIEHSLPIPLPLELEFCGARCQQRVDLRIFAFADSV